MEREKEWNSSLDETGWLQLVAYCLLSTGRILEFMAIKKRSVIIQGMPRGSS